ncbi:MAG: cyclic nucleotide-binding domain-containing protein [Myxococcales bacterium]|nr:cyclic nucleotide-binding domain-containing protein [Myxococcales bacterium]MCB9737380.1 cyclic nucleotide-binding domain-containing protein [Deltaproteobacteria bacterium]
MPDRSLVNPMERVLAMRASPIFHDLPAVELDTMAEYAREVVYRRGDVLQSADRPPAAIHLIVEGDVEVVRDDAVAMRLSAPAGVGALDLFARTDGGTRVTALTEVLALSFPVDLVLEIIEDQFAVLHAILKRSAAQLIETYAKIEGDRDIPDASERPPCRCVGDMMNLVERLVFLRRMPIFAQSSLDAVTEIARAFREVRVPAGETLWRVGDEAKTLLALVDGQALATIPGTSSKVRYHRYSMLGAMCSLAQVPRYHDMVAVTPLVLLEADGSRLLDVIEDNHEMGLTILSGLAREMIDVQRRLRDEGARRLDWSWMPSREAADEGAVEDAPAPML